MVLDQNIILRDKLSQRDLISCVPRQYLRQSHTGALYAQLQDSIYAFSAVYKASLSLSPSMLITLLITKEHLPRRDNDTTLGNVR